jgi:hypothetical protein
MQRCVKGIVPRNFLFELLKIETVLVWALMVFTISDGFFCEEKPNIKFLLTFMKSLTNYENPSRNPIRRACSGFQRANCHSKIVTKTTCDLENCSESQT